MTVGAKGPVPLAFLLAMAADASGASVADASRDMPLEPGSLAPLLQGTVIRSGGNLTASGEALYQPVPGYKTAQFFPNFPSFPNFNNCFNGNWRNC